MISVIKLRRVVGLADLHGVNVLAFISCVLSCGLNIAILARFGFDICMIQLWVWMDSVSLGIVSFLSLLRLFFVHQDAFYIALHLAANFGTNVAVLI